MSERINSDHAKDEPTVKALVQLPGTRRSDGSPSELYGRFESSKTYNHSIGLSCCFRQWKAKSHCKFLHGYALKVNLHFESTYLNSRNWVVDFGSLKPIKAWLEETFDHKTLVATDDPELSLFESLNNLGLIQLVKVQATGCEAMAWIIYQEVEKWLIANDYHTQGVILRKVTVSEHEGNSSSYFVQ